MLEVIGFHPVEDTALEIDEYVPLRFRCQDTFDPVPLYWRTGDFHRQLIEIGLNPYSGAVCKITVTGLGEHSLSPVTLEFTPQEVVSGIPICEISHWPPNALDYKDRFRDQRHLCRIVLKPDSVIIMLRDSPQVKRVYRVEHLDFGVGAENRLVLLRFTGLTREDIATIIARQA